MSPLVWVDVDSSCLAAVAFADGTLWLRFKKSGKVYRYPGVPADVHRALLEAGSHGTYFADHIRGQYVGVPA